MNSPQSPEDPRIVFARRLRELWGGAKAHSNGPALSLAMLAQAAQGPGKTTIHEWMRGKRRQLPRDWEELERVISGILMLGMLGSETGELTVPVSTIHPDLRDGDGPYLLLWRAWFQNAKKTPRIVANPGSVRHARIDVERIHRLYAAKLGRWVDEAIETSLGIRLDPTSYALQSRARKIRRFLSLEGNPHVQATDDSPCDIPAIFLKERSFVLVGPPLAGKTFAMLGLAKVVVDQYQNGELTAVPFVISGQVVDKDSTVADVVEKTVGLDSLTSKFCRDTLAEDSVPKMFFVDGLDEAIRWSAMKRLLQQIADIPQSMIVVTTRLTFTESFPRSLEDAVYLMEVPPTATLIELAEKTAREATPGAERLVLPPVSSSVLDSVGGACLLGLWLAESPSRHVPEATLSKLQLLGEILRIRCLREVRRWTGSDDHASQIFERDWPTLESQLGAVALETILFKAARLADDADQILAGPVLDPVGQQAVRWLISFQDGAPRFTHRSFVEYLAARRLANMATQSLKETIEQHLIGVPGARRLLAMAIGACKARERLLAGLIGADQHWPNGLDIALERTILALDIMAETSVHEWAEHSRDLLRCCLERGILSEHWAALVRISPEWWSSLHYEELLNLIQENQSKQGLDILFRVAPHMESRLASILLKNIRTNFNVFESASLLLRFEDDENRRRRILKPLTAAALEADHPNRAIAIVQLIAGSWPKEDGSQALVRIASKAASPVGAQRATILVASRRAASAAREPRIEELRAIAARADHREARFMAWALIASLTNEDVTPGYRRLAGARDPDDTTCWSLRELAAAGSEGARRKLEAISGRKDIAAPVRAEALNALITLSKAAESDVPAEVENSMLATEVPSPHPEPYMPTEVNFEKYAAALADESIDMRKRADLLQRLVAQYGAAIGPKLEPFMKSSRWHAHLRNTLAGLVIQRRLDLPLSEIQTMLIRNLSDENVHMHSAFESIVNLSQIAPRETWIAPACESLRIYAMEPFFTRVALERLAILGGKEAAVAIADGITAAQYVLPSMLEYLRWALASARNEVGTVEWFNLTGKAQGATLRILQSGDWPDEALWP